MSRLNHNLTRHRVIDPIEYNSNTELISSKEYTRKTTGESYRVINLIPQSDRDGLKTDELNPSSLAVYRSVIIRNNHLLSVAPPKRISTQKFIEKYSLGRRNGEVGGGSDGGHVGTIYVNEIIEGTMINLFFDSKIGDWEIATKSAVGGNYCYFRTQYPEIGVNCIEMTFRNMFLEACIPNHDDRPEIGFGDWTSYLDRDLVYSFVLQHPLNHIVGWIDSPKVYLVSVFRKHANKKPIEKKEKEEILVSRMTLEENVEEEMEEIENVIEYISPLEYESWEMFSHIPIYFPKWIPFQGNDEGNGNEYYSELMHGMSNRGFAYPGVMITELTTGDRCRIDNPEYLRALEVRGNHPNMQYHYLDMLKKNGIAEFLAYFPMYYDIFSRFYMQLSIFVHNVHQAYVDRYILKVVVEGCVPKKYAPHVWRLHHQVYLPRVMETGRGMVVGHTIGRFVVRNEIVWEYIMGLKVSEIMIYLNM